MLIKTSKQKKPIEDEEEKEEDHIKVDEELANKISLFFAYPTPMMKVLIDTTTVSDLAWFDTLK